MRKVQLDMIDSRHAKIKLQADKEYMSVVAYCQRAVDWCMEGKASPQTIIAVKSSRPVGRPAKDMVSARDEKLARVNAHIVALVADFKDWQSWPDTNPGKAPNMQAGQKHLAELLIEQQRLQAGGDVPLADKPIQDCTSWAELFDHPDYDALDANEQDALYNALKG